MRAGRPIGVELIVDNFAGGGASLGISRALGRAVDVAINHGPAAVLMHRRRLFLVARRDGGASGRAHGQ